MQGAEIKRTQGKVKEISVQISEIKYDQRKNQVAQLEKNKDTEIKLTNLSDKYAHLETTLKITNTAQAKMYSDHAMKTLGAKAERDVLFDDQEKMWSRLGEDKTCLQKLEEENKEFSNR